MFKNIFRIVVGVQGVLALFMAGNAFMYPGQVANQLGLTLISNLGLSTFRSDIGSLFAGSGLFMLMAAFRSEARLLLVPLVYTGIAPILRIITALEAGFLPGFTLPMGIESMTIVLLLVGMVALRRS